MRAAEQVCLIPKQQKCPTPGSVCVMTCIPSSIDTETNRDRERAARNFLDVKVAANQPRKRSTARVKLFLSRFRKANKAKKSVSNEGSSSLDPCRPVQRRWPREAEDSRTRWREAAGFCFGVIGFANKKPNYDSVPIRPNTLM